MGMECDFSSEREQHGLRMCESGVLRSMLGLSRRYKEGAGENNMLSTEDICSWYSFSVYY
jgi:hypothetical protein